MENNKGKDKKIQEKRDKLPNEKKNYTRDINSDPPAGTKPKDPKKQG